MSDCGLSVQHIKTKLYGRTGSPSYNNKIDKLCSRTYRPPFLLKLKSILTYFFPFVKPKTKISFKVQRKIFLKRKVYILSVFRGISALFRCFTLCKSERKTPSKKRQPTKRLSFKKQQSGVAFICDMLSKAF